MAAISPRVPRKLPVCPPVQMTVFRNYMTCEGYCRTKLRAWKKTAISSTGLVKMLIVTTFSSWKLPRYVRKPVELILEFRTFLKEIFSVSFAGGPGGAAISINP
jgi:hypothetical protein